MQLWMRVAINGIPLLLVGWFLVTQIIIPVARNTPLFPIFSARRERKLKQQLAKERQAAVEDEITQEIKTLRKERRKHS